MQSVSRSGTSEIARDDALDFVKGALVVLMVVYHWVSLVGGQQLIDYRYIRFITPSFVLITGFVVSHVYLKKFAWDSPALAGRLIQRGLKLICLFAVLNLGALGPELGSNTPWAYWVDWMTAVLVYGEGRASFIILLSIGYFLILAPFALFAAARLRVPLAVTAVLAVAMCWVSSIFGRTNLHGEFLSMGLIGLAAGATANTQGYTARMAPAWLAMVYALHLAAVATWNVIYPVQVIAACVNVLALYRLGRAVAMASALRWIVTLGKYSLFAYIAQILILRLIRMAVKGSELTPMMLGLTFVIALVATVGSVQLVALLRGRISAADRLYRTVFA